MIGKPISVVGSKKPVVKVIVGFVADTEAGKRREGGIALPPRQRMVLAKDVVEGVCLGPLLRTVT